MLIDKINKIDNSLTSFGKSISNVYGVHLNDYALSKWSNIISQISLSEDAFDYGEDPEPISDVNFYDYDGSLLYRYTREEFLNLGTLPSTPNHNTLTCLGWNWDLNRAKSYVEKYGVLNIGAVYNTNDGKTRLYITLQDSQAVTLKFNQTEINGVVIEWGDGNEETINKSGDVSISHVYQTHGQYVIGLNASCEWGYNSSAEPLFNSDITDDLDNVYFNSELTKIEFGNYITSIPIIYGCLGLECMSISSSVEHVGSITGCPKLKSINLPQQVGIFKCDLSSEIIDVYNIMSDFLVIDIGTAILDCCGLKSLCLSQDLVEFGGISMCNNLQSITIPDSVNTFINGVQYCLKLKHLIIPDSVFIFPYIYENVILEDISHLMIGYCLAAEHIYVSKNLPDNIFVELASVSIEVIDFLPANLIHFPGIFSCSKLKHIDIPDNLEVIGDVQLSEDITSASGLFGITPNKLQYIKFPKKLTLIQGGSIITFNGSVLDFSNCEAVPELSQSDALSLTNAICKILVPAGLYDEWINSTNWADYADNITAYSASN